MEVFACAAWNIWKIRNEFVFRKKPPNFGGWKVQFSSDLDLHQFKAREKKPRYFPLFSML
jgi:hypothetical protein